MARGHRMFKRPPTISLHLSTPLSDFLSAFFLSNYSLSNLCFLVNAPQSVSLGLSSIRIKPGDGVSKHLTAQRHSESPLLWLVQKKGKTPDPEHCSVFLKRIVFHPCHHSKWMLLKWWLRTEGQQERSTVRWNSFRAWVSGNGGLIYCLT